MSRLSLHFLGAFQVILDDNPISAFRSDKVRALLAYLALEADREHRRDVLAGFFWPDMSDSLARKNLRLTLHRLRQTLGDAENGPAFLQISKEAVQLDKTAVWLDAAAFTKLLDSVETHPHQSLEACPICASQLEAAVELYRGDFLQGFYLDDNLAFSEWVLLKRETLHRRTLWALHHLAAYFERRSDHEQALRFAWRQLELEPWREEAHRQVMDILARRGERSAALAQYEVCCRILAEELNAEPSEVTTSLYRRIRSTQHGRHNLPGQPTPFVGREEEVAEVIGLLENPDCRLLTLVGPGGIGKTRLALAAVAARVDSFLEGVYFVPLAAVNSVDFLVPAIIDTLRFAYPGSQNPERQLLDYLREKELLLILDNFEHLLAGTALLTGILEKCPKIKLLVTSRERLNVSWEWCFQVGGLHVPPDEGIGEDVLEAYSALKLFQQAAQRVQKRFSLTEREKPAAARICQLVEGMPLGIELAAVWVGTHTCEEIATEVARNLAFLETSLQDVPLRHRSLQATFAHSWHLLTPTEQQVFMKLSVFQHGFQHDAAEKIANATRFVLKSLTDKSLLRFVPPGRYEIHELLRQYAADWLATTPDLPAAVRDRHCSYYMAFLQNQAAALNGADALKAQAAIQLEMGNVRAAWDWGIRHDRLDEVQLGLNGLARYYVIAGPFQEGERHMDAAVLRVRKRVSQAGETLHEDQLLLSKLLIEQARFLNRQSKYEQAITAVHEAINLAQVGPMGDVALEAAGYVQLGQAFLSLGEYNKAALQLNRALTLARIEALPQVEVDSLRRLGAACLDQGRYGEANKFNKMALEIYLAMGNKQGEAGALRGLGLAAWRLGKDAEAKAYFEQAVAIFQEIGDQHGMALQLHNLGRVGMEQGDYAQAREYFEQALPIYQEIGDRQNVSWTRLNLGRVRMYQGDYRQGKAFCQEALSTFREIGARQGEALALVNIGGICGQIGAYDESAAALDEALDICRKIGDWQSESWACIYRADLAAALGAFSAAQTYLENALKLTRKIGDRAGEGWGLCNLSMLFYLTGQQAAGLDFGEQALLIAREQNHLPLQAATRLHLGHIFLAMDKVDMAATHYQTAVSLHRQLSQQHLAVEGLAGQARIALSQDNASEALALVEEILHYLQIEENVAIDAAPLWLDSGRSLDGTEEPFRIYLTCFRVLSANQDSRAREILAMAYHSLQKRAATIADPNVRNAYLTNIAAHQMILDEWSSNGKWHLPKLTD